MNKDIKYTENDKTNKGFILGVSCFYHDSAACLIKDGEIIAAAQEERFTRIKHDHSIPTEAINYCLKEAGININDISYITFYDKPILTFDRILKTFLKVWPMGFPLFLKMMKAWLGEKLWTDYVLRKKLKYKGEILFVPHHVSHAAGSYFCSPFQSATIVTVDGVGEWATTTISTAKENKLKMEEEIHFPHSLGLLYSAFTYYLGFKVNSAEYKVMGLSPYGEIKYKKEIYKLINVFADGSYKLNMDYFKYEYKESMINKNKFKKLFNIPVRKPNDKLEQCHMDLASSLQAVLEEVLLKIIDHAYKKYPNENLCLSGGVALNCVANEKVIRKSKFKNLFVQPASGDAGSSVGAAYYLYNHVLNNKKTYKLEDVYFGPSFSNHNIEEFLNEKKIPYVKMEDSFLFKQIAKYINENKVIGLFQGRMEFGPRALGNRSIIADPRKKENWQRVNLKIKFRESFRPFAPSVLEEETKKYFDCEYISPYMLVTAPVKNKTIPAVTHVNDSARLQTVSKKHNPRYWNIIKEFENISGCPVIINTSFNVRGEPIVCSIIDAFKCFLRTDMDVLVLENYIINNKDIKTEFKKIFKLEKFEDD